MMTLSERDMQALGSIENGLAGSDPLLASMLNIFSRLAAGEEMPARKKTRVRRDPRPGWSRAMLLAWVAISGGLLAVGLILNTGGHKACTGWTGTGCPSLSISPHQHP